MSGPASSIDLLMRIIINCNSFSLPWFLLMKISLLLVISAVFLGHSALAHDINAMNESNVVQILATHFVDYFFLGSLAFALCQLTNFRAFVFLNLALVIFLSKHGQEIVGSGEGIPIIIWLTGTFLTIWVGNRVLKSVYTLVFEAIIRERLGKEKNYAKEK